MPPLHALRWPALTGTPRSLVVLCHGLGESGTRWASFVKVVAPALPHTGFVAPDGPEPAGNAPEGRRWWDYLDPAPGTAEAGVAAAALLLSDFLRDEAARHALPLGKCALVGFSQGAMMVLHAALRQPAAPAVALCYAGKLIGPAPAAGEVTSRPPVLLVHGRDDVNVPPIGSSDAAAVLSSLGVEASALLLDGLDHTIDGRAMEVGAVFLRGHLPG